MAILSPLRYAVITPARNEAENLRRLGSALISQTVKPSAWIIVDDGSTDETASVAKSLARDYRWIKVVESPGSHSREGPLVEGRRAGRDVVAFNAGLAVLRRDFDVLVKLDADTSADPDYFERLLAKFENDQALGIASGTSYELDAGVWRENPVTRSHVRGPARAYRWECFQQIAPLEERLGWDVVDELKAKLRGWHTTNFRDLPFYHHRAMGSRDGAARHWLSQGETAHFVGYRLWYLTLRALFHARREPSALLMIAGYCAAAVTRQPRHPERAVRALLRRQMTVRHLPQRVREALGSVPTDGTRTR